MNEKPASSQQKLQDLKEKLTQARYSDSKKDTDSLPPDHWGRLISLGIELFSCFIIGLGIGFTIDYYFNSKPIALILFSFFGGAAGVVTIYRRLK